MVGLPVMVLKSMMNTIISMVLAVMRLVEGTIIEIIIIMIIIIIIITIIITIIEIEELSESSGLVLLQSHRIAFVV